MCQSAFNFKLLNCISDIFFIYAVHAVHTLQLTETNMIFYKANFKLIEKLDKWTRNCTNYVVFSLMQPHSITC